MARTKFLITGATGATGGYTARQLLEKQHAVRVLAHRPDERSEKLQKLGAEVVFGDFLDFDSVRAALKGVQRAYFCYPISPGIVQATAQFAQAAKEVGVEVIVNMSMKSARSDATSNAARQHWLSERVFEWSGVPAVHLRPTLFAEWLLYLAPMIREGRMLAPFTTTGRHAPVAAEDQARLIVGILQHPTAHVGKTYPLFGPVELTHPEIAAIISHAIGKEVRYQHVPIEQFAEILSSSPKGPAQNTAMANYGDPGALTGGSPRTFLMQHLREGAMDHSNGILAGTNNYIAEIGGRQPTTLEAFIAKHRKAFASQPRRKTWASLKEIALITGGNGGIGLATAKRFVKEGAYVFITGRREPETAAAVEEIGRNVTGVQGDVSNLGDLDRLFAQIKREKGRLDIVFANAGVVKLAPLGTITEELYDTVFNINVKGVLFTVQKALPLLPDGASIILNASIGASKGPPANSVNCATKAAVRSFARTLTTDLKNRRIRVNALSPGVIDTPGLKDVMASSETGRQLGQMISGAAPLGRFGTPDEIAKAVVFLASDDSSYITGTELSVDGGFAQV